MGSDQRIASYTTLPAGTYVFHVQGALSRGRWSEPGASLEIEVLPAWWNSWWFRMFYGTLLLLDGIRHLHAPCWSEKARRGGR